MLISDRGALRTCPVQFRISAVVSPPGVPSTRKSSMCLPLTAPILPVRTDTNRPVREDSSGRLEDCTVSGRAKRRAGRTPQDHLADRQRPARQVDGWDFKTYVLGMLFYRLLEGSHVLQVARPQQEPRAISNHARHTPRLLGTQTGPLGRKLSYARRANRLTTRVFKLCCSRSAFRASSRCSPTGRRRLNLPENFL